MVDFIAYDPVYKSDLAALWQDSWLSSNPVVFSGDTIERLHGRIDEELAAGWDVTLALRNTSLLGFLAIKEKEAWLDQLFIAPDAQSQGIGRQLLDRAKLLMAKGFRLRTSIQNLGARRFYSRHGLIEVAFTKSPYRNLEVVVIEWKPN